MTWLVSPARPAVYVSRALVICLLATACHSMETDGPSVGDSERTMDLLAKKAAFSAWAGKRNFLENFSRESSEAKRSAFHSWAGKRGVEDGEGRRPAVNSWAGQLVDEGKRAAFNAWAGKRNTESTIGDDKRAAFNAWAGKRAMAFSSWAGKRTGQIKEHSRDTELIGGRDDTSSDSKRAAFSSWAGKRSTANPKLNLAMLDWYLSQALAKVMQKRKFSAWAGKRNNGPPFMQMARRRFGPWSG